MASEETVDEIVKRVRRECNSYPLPTEAAEMLKLVREIEAAHKREVAELVDVLIGDRRRDQQEYSGGKEMKKLSKLGISPTPWMANGHWLDCADGEFFAFKDSDEGYANAKLTAAAPKMYKKAWELITAFDKLIMTPKHIEALRAALAEASGEKEENR